jgi:hypothetical protein
MTSFRTYLRRHHVGLLALLLILSGGVSYAAGALPKNSVKSAQIKNNAVKGKDLKDSTVTGTDVGDGRLTGADLADGSVARADLARGSVDEVDVVYISSADGTVTLFDEPGIGKITFGVSCSPDYAVNSFATAGLSPARAGSYGLEQFHAPGEAVDAAPLVGAATVSRLNDTGMPTGGAGFGGSSFGFGQLVLFTQTSTKDVYADITVSYCSARAVVSIDNKPAGSVLTATSGKRRTVCTATGAAVCQKES